VSRCASPSCHRGTTSQRRKNVSSARTETAVTRARRGPWTRVVPPRVRQRHHKPGDLELLAGQSDRRLAEVDLGLTRRMRQGRKTSWRDCFPGPDRVLHYSLATLIRGHASGRRHAGSTRRSAPADERLSRTPCRIALQCLPEQRGQIGGWPPILPLHRTALMCAAKLNRRDTSPRRHFEPPSTLARRQSPRVGYVRRAVFFSHSVACRLSHNLHTSPVVRAPWA
jgi:hypothetical protein